MSNNNTINRRNVLGGAAALAASTAVIPGTARAQSANAAVDAFYGPGQYTYCDAKVLARYWAASPSVNSVWDAKVLGGQKILNGSLAFLKKELRSAGQAFEQAGQNCTYAEVDNPNYTERDLNDLARYWNAKNGNNSYKNTHDVKLKIMLNVVGGGNPWVRNELDNARRQG